MSKYDALMQKFGFYYVRDQKRQPTKAETEDLERRLGGSLPPTYADLVDEYGGTAFEKRVKFPITAPCSWGARGSVNVFFGFLDEEDVYDLRWNLNTYEGRVPRELLPIANDPGGNLVLLGIRGENEGRLFFWDHENEQQPGPDGNVGYGNICLVASDLDAFMNSLFAKEA
jgi:hypothetical protein